MKAASNPNIQCPAPQATHRIPYAAASSFDAALTLPPEPAHSAAPDGLLEQSNVVWNSPSANSRGSMPLGNGDIGANVWVEPTGDLVLLLSKTDAYDAFNRLLKIGRVRIKTEPALVQPGAPFLQTLNLRDGCIDIQAGDTTVRIWIDANHPVVQADIQGKTPMTVEAAAEIWRTETRKLDRKAGSEDEGHSAAGNPADQMLVRPDIILPASDSGIAWCQHNTSSLWADNLKLTALDAEIAKHQDPILHRSFGAVVSGSGMKPASDLVLNSTQPGVAASIRITILTQVADTPAAWRALADTLADKTPSDTPARFAAHREWWRAFWNRSWIFVSPQPSAHLFPGTVNPHSLRVGVDSAGGSRVRGEVAEEIVAPVVQEDARQVTQAYILQRFISACSGRGALPIKFNGTIFTVDQVFDPDYRRWGGGYWWQNTRLPYWAMLHAGDFDMMQPLFRTYMDALPLRKAATTKYYGHAGAFFPETMNFWGNYLCNNYGLDREGKPDGLTDNLYIRRYWQSGMELLVMMLDYHDITRDAVFRDNTLLPMAREIAAFYDQHWKRGDDGKIHYSPSQSLETWWVATNPLPEIIGWRYLIPRLLELPADDATKAAWRRQLADQPEVPTVLRDGKRFLVPAASYEERRNAENPELYAVFPYRAYTLMAGGDALQTALNTWHGRRERANRGWQQGPIKAALLGLAAEAQSQIVNRTQQRADGYRFPAIYGPNYDWTPDQCHFTVCQTALQYMLMQCEGDKILILPAWPKEWDVHFKLHAPQQTTIEGEVKDGKVVKLIVTPESRRKDITITENETP